MITKQSMPKFLMSIGDATLKKLEKEADKREISVQELIRAVIVPDWLDKQTIR